MMEAMAAVTKAHVQFCQSNGSSVFLGANYAWMREVKAAHNYTTHQAQDALVESGHPDLEVPVPQTPAIKKAKMIETRWNTSMLASRVSWRR